MKLSSRKKLLEDADETLKQIRQRIINEQPWEPEKYKAQKGALSALILKRNQELEALEKHLKEKIGEIQGRYYNANTESSKQQEIQELINMVEKIKKHLIENWKEIPDDPEQQSEIQKMITSAPKLPPDFDIEKDYAKALIKDPDTGMYWARIGVPVLPPDWEQVYQQHRLDLLGVGRESHNILYDKSKPLIYRIIKSFFTWNTNTTYE